MVDPSRVRGWLRVAAATAILTPLFVLLAVPAALLLGPLVAAILVAARHPGLTMPGWTTTVSQAAVGCVIAGAIGGAFGAVVIAHWPVFASIAGATILASGGIGYALGRLGVVPGPVAVWGSMPGGAVAMILMAEADGADARLVAVMVYTRVVTVTAAATLLAALLGTGVPTAAIAALPAPLWLTMAVALAGIGGAALLRWPAGTLMLTMAIGVAAEAMGTGALRVPLPASIAAFTLIGWRIGLSFTHDARGAALRMLPRLILATMVLVAFCGLLALALHLALGVDLLTAWLATSPGGLESVAIIATSLSVDTPFIMAAQTARFAAVMLVGPALALLLSRRSRRRASHDAR